MEAVEGFPGAGLTQHFPWTAMPILGLGAAASFLQWLTGCAEGRHTDETEQRQQH
jgi:hypothetical protein